MKQNSFVRITLAGLVFLGVINIFAACSGDDDDGGGEPSPGFTSGTPGAAPGTAPGDAVTPPPVAEGGGGGPEPGGKLAFYSFRDGDQEIYTMDVDGGNQTNITNNEAEDFEPDWSPDGSQIAFASDREGPVHVFVMNADGSGVRRLTQGGGGYLSPRWAPGGETLVVSRSGTLILVNAADGAEIKTLFEPQLEESAAPCRGPGFPGGWSPEGARVTYYSASATRQLAEVCTVDAESGEIKVIVKDPPAIHAEPVWSADGRYLSYRSIRGENSDIYVIDLETGEERRLTDPPEVDAEPEWSPDGEWIAFVSYREFPNSDVYLMRKDGSDVRRLTTDEAKDTYPVWTD